MNNNILDYHIIVAAKDRVKINTQYIALKDFIERRECVPYQIVQTFLGLLQDKDGFVDEQLDVESAEKAQLAEQRLIALKYYHVEFTEPDGTFISFNELLRLCIRGYFEKRKEENIKSKEAVICFFYDALTNFVKPMLTHDIKEQFVNNKIHVITAILTEVCWTKVTSHKNPTAAQLREGVRYAIKKCK
jgi:hypothetical protein